MRMSMWHWKPSFLPFLIFDWRTFSRRVTACWWSQSAKNQVSTNQNWRNRWCHIASRTICYVRCDYKYVVVITHAKLQINIWMFGSGWKLQAEIKMILFLTLLSFESSVYVKQNRDSKKYFSTEATVLKFSKEYLIWKISRNSWEGTCDGFLFLFKVASLDVQVYQKRTPYQVFSSYF